MKNSLSLKKIVIVGGGAGGLELATKLGHRLGVSKKAEITLVDINYNHIWKPLLHKMASGSLNSWINTVSYVAHARNHSFNFQLGCMVDIDRYNQKVLLDSIRNKNGELLVSKRALEYDILTIALGSTTNDFGISGVNDHCIFLDNSNQAKDLHQKIFNLFLKFSLQKNTDKKINIAIIGGGSTGVELSAELYNTAQKLHDYSFFKNINKQILNIMLIEAGERILPALPSRLSFSAHKKLVTLGIRILTNTMVINIVSDGLHTKNNKYIEAELMIWTAGIKVSDFVKNLAGLETNYINQFIVLPTLQTTRDPIIFAIGDCSSCSMTSGEKVPPRAQAAHQMASCVYFNILAMLQTNHLKNYIYKDHGSLISLSQFNTIGSLISNITKDPIIIEGKIARVAYLSLYRMHQIVLHGYIKTGLIVLVDWINRVINLHIKLH